MVGVGRGVEGQEVGLGVVVLGDVGAHDREEHDEDEAGQAEDGAPVTHEAAAEDLAAGQAPGVGRLLGGDDGVLARAPADGRPVDGARAGTALIQLDIAHDSAHPHTRVDDGDQDVR